MALKDRLKNKIDRAEEEAVKGKAPATPAPKPKPKAAPKQGLIERTRATMKALDKPYSHQRPNERKLTKGKTPSNDIYLRNKMREEKAKNRKK